jgi:hypothetical protein
MWGELPRAAGLDPTWPLIGLAVASVAITAFKLLEGWRHRRYQRQQLELLERGRAPYR